MRRTAIYILSAISFFVFSSFITTEDPITALLKKLQEFTRINPQEKVYLHLDKPYYAIGDDIWFKAYLADARTSLPKVASSILYVELINERDSLQQQLKLPIQDGVTWGDFKLTDTLNEGNYRIRAYTQLMRNSGPDFFFDKHIKIGKLWTDSIFTEAIPLINNAYSLTFTNEKREPYINKNVSYSFANTDKKTLKGKGRTDTNGKIILQIPTPHSVKYILAILDLGGRNKISKTIPVRTTFPEIDVKFFPEGGNLVQGISSRIGVKAIGTNGLGIDVKGTIVDQNDNEITRFETSHLGMGSFFINPIATNTYTAKIQLGDGTYKSVKVPQHQKDGYIMTINNSDRKELTIRLTMSTEMMKKGELNLIAHKNGSVILATKIPTDKQTAKITLKKEEIPSGVMELTLFSPQGEPVAERVIFVDNEEQRIAINLAPLEKSYKIRDKVSLEINTLVNSKPNITNLSVSVTNASIIKPDSINETNILTSLLLSSDLKGHIEQPNSYFLGNNKQKAEWLDNLMLTQGWRKIDWKGLDRRPTYAVEDGVHISGTVSKNGKILPKSKITLVSNIDRILLIDTVSDDKGKFAFRDLIFKGQQQFVVQARSENDKKTVSILLDTVPPQKISSSNNIADMELNVNSGMKTYLDHSNAYFEEKVKTGALTKTIQLKEVKIIGKKNPAEYSANLNGPGNADQVLDGDDMLNAVTLSTYLVGKFERLKIKNGKPVTLSNGAVKIFLDGMLMYDDFTLNDIFPEQVASIEVLISVTKTAIYGPGIGASILITSRRGPVNWPVIKYAPGLVTYRPTGYYLAREFYSPRYDVKLDDRRDLRTTVYWNPNLVTDNTGMLKFDYFNTDQPGTYRIVIEGMDASGNLAREVLTYNVN